MVIVEFQNIELDTCLDCHGLWFDAQELGQLFELAGVPERYHDLESQVDRLPHVGPRRRCPRCRRQLESVRAPSTERRIDPRRMSARRWPVVRPGRAGIAAQGVAWRNTPTR